MKKKFISGTVVTLIGIAFWVGICMGCSEGVDGGVTWANFAGMGLMVLSGKAFAICEKKGLIPEEYSDAKDNNEE